MNPDYEVVSPIGDAEDASGSKREAFGAKPLDDLPGKRIGLIWTEFANGDVALRAFREHLSERYPDVAFVEMEPGRGTRWGDQPKASIAELAREHALDGAIVAAGC